MRCWKTLFIVLPNNLLKTERAYVMWIRRFVHLHNLRHPREMGAAEIHSFLQHLANDRDVSSSTHN